MWTPKEGLPQSAVELSLVAVKYRHTPIYQFFIELNQQIAMLHPDVLALLHYIGANAASPILELGPYIGGSTIAMAKGIASGDRSQKITTVEKGEGYVHEKLTTPDIIMSLRDNLIRHEVEDQVNIVVGYSRDQAIVQQVAEYAKTTKFGCMVMDADGCVDDDLRCYKSLLQPRAYLVVDDYYAPGAPDKEAITRPQIDRLEQRGIVESFGVHGWGTWFGRLV